jgi:hypothetical protein
MTMRKLPIGVSDFKTVIKENYAYIDKTLFIQELVELGVQRVALIPRMRRFGKTLNLSMLRYFFEKIEEDTSHLFRSLNIWKDEKYRALQGNFPVIFLSWKEIKYSTWDETFDALRRCIAKEFERHRYLLEAVTLSQEEKETYRSFLRAEGSPTLYADALSNLTNWLERYHKMRVVLLIDEYDTPAQSAYIGGFYAHCIPFLRNCLSAGLKDNSSLEYGVLTGILRVTKESIFSGLNNLGIFTIFDETFQDKFGLTEAEVEGLLLEYSLQDNLPEIRNWYNGYRIGSTNGMYNPWSVLNCIENRGKLDTYWVNTSENELIGQLMRQGSDELKTDLEDLLRGEIIEKGIEKGIVYSDLEESDEAVWSLLVSSGYLTFSKNFLPGIPTRLKIPNIEVQKLYQSLIQKWFVKSIKAFKYKLLLQSLLKGDIDTFSRIFQKFIISSFSAFDITREEPERVYHAFVLGLLVGLSDTYEVKSNRESGFGRYDVMLLPKNPGNLGIVMEFKKIDSFDSISLEEAVLDAFKQIEEKEYATELIDRGVKRVLYLAMAFEGKKVLIRAKFKE